MHTLLTARMRPASAFFDAYMPADLATTTDDGQSLLMMALGNKDLASRYEIASFLLDEGAPLGGAGPKGATVLHVLFGQVKHDIAADAAVARRLIDQGADINALDDANRLPFLEVLNMKYGDEDLAPIYNLWFEQPEVDFRTESVHGTSPLSAARAMPYRASILARMEEYVATRS